MTAKIILVSILDLLLGLNFLSPAVLIRNSLENNESSLDLKTENQPPYFLPSAETNYFPIRDWEVVDPSLNVGAILVYDSASEKTLFSLSPEAKLPIASLTKLMTAVMVVENIDLSDAVTITESAIEKSRREGGGNDLYKGEKIKAADLLKIMLIESSNVAAYAFDEHLEAKYKVNLIEKMNQKAWELKMADTYFTEAAGLDDKDSFSTAHDLVKLAKYSLRYESLYGILKTQKAEVASIDGNLKHRIFNTNELLGKLFNIIGGKTGFTELAGGSIILVTEAPNQESRLITVVLGSKDRFVDAQTLVNWAQKAYIWK